MDILLHAAQEQMAEDKEGNDAEALWHKHHYSRSQREPAWRPNEPQTSQYWLEYEDVLMLEEQKREQDGRLSDEATPRDLTEEAKRGAAAMQKPAAAEASIPHKKPPPIVVTTEPSCSSFLIALFKPTSQSPSANPISWFIFFLLFVVSFCLPVQAAAARVANAPAGAVMNELPTLIQYLPIDFILTKYFSAPLPSLFLFVVSLLFLESTYFQPAGRKELFCRLLMCSLFSVVAVAALVSWTFQLGSCGICGPALVWHVFVLAHLSFVYGGGHQEWTRRDICVHSLLFLPLLLFSHPGAALVGALSGSLIHGLDLPLATRDGAPFFGLGHGCNNVYMCHMGGRQGTPISAYSALSPTSLQKAKAESDKKCREKPHTDFVEQKNAASTAMFARCETEPALVLAIVYLAAASVAWAATEWR